jgi:hypothetical protein
MSIQSPLLAQAEAIMNEAMIKAGTKGNAHGYFRETSLEIIKLANNATASTFDKLEAFAVACELSPHDPEILRLWTRRVSDYASQSTAASNGPEAQEQKIRDYLEKIIENAQLANTPFQAAAQKLYAHNGRTGHGSAKNPSRNRAPVMGGVAAYRNPTPRT